VDTVIYSNQFIYTSEQSWFKQVTHCYRKKEPFTLVDDSDLGVDPAIQHIYEMGRLAKMTSREWMATLVSLGLCGIGLRMMVLAVIDPEPTSKLGLLVASGTVLALTGGLNSVRILTHLKPPSITVSANQFGISWE